MSVWMSGRRRRPAGADHSLRLGEVAAGSAKRRVVARYASSAGFDDEQRLKAAGRVAERLKPAARRKADASLRYDRVGHHAQCAQLLASLVCEGRSITGF